MNKVDDPYDMHAYDIGQIQAGFLHCVHILMVSAKRAMAFLSQFFIVPSNLYPDLDTPIPNVWIPSHCIFKAQSNQ